MPTIPMSMGIARTITGTKIPRFAGSIEAPAAHQAGAGNRMRAFARSARRLAGEGEGGPMTGCDRQQARTESGFARLLAWAAAPATATRSDLGDGRGRIHG